jgi:hypothetical protein
MIIVVIVAMVITATPITVVPGIISRAKVDGRATVVAIIGIGRPIVTRVITGDANADTHNDPCLGGGRD